MLLDCSFQAVEKSIWSARPHFGEPQVLEASWPSGCATIVEEEPRFSAYEAAHLRRRYAGRPTGYSQILSSRLQIIRPEKCMKHLTSASVRNIPGVSGPLLMAAAGM